MSFQEKKSIVSLFSTCFVFILYICCLIYGYHEQIITIPINLSFWGLAILLLIPITILAKIIIHVVFVFINQTVTKEEEILFADELDKLIELKATKSSHWVFVFGFFLSMVALVMDMQPFIMFLMFIISAFLSGMMRDITQIYFYRKGI